MAIDPDVKRLSESRKTAVAVPEQMPGIIVAFVPDSKAIMTKDDRISLDHNIHQIGRLEKAAGILFLHSLIMSPADQDNITVQPLEDGPPVPPGKISQVINKISLPHPGVPLGDQRLVHFFDGGKWAPAIMNNIGVIEMRVCRKKDIPHNPAPTSESLAK